MRLINNVGLPDNEAIQAISDALALEYLRQFPDGKIKTPTEYADEFLRVQKEICEHIKRHG